jgi:adhesin HecA-like repeat protein
MPQGEWELCLRIVIEHQARKAGGAVTVRASRLSNARGKLSGVDVSVAGVAAVNGLVNAKLDVAV